MSDTTSSFGDHELEQALRDLGAHLDLGPGDAASGRAALVTAVLDRIADGIRPIDGAGPRRARRHRTRLVLVAAAVVLIVLGTLLAVTPTREAIARWLGIGGVRITQSDGGSPAGPDPAPGAPTGSTGVIGAVGQGAPDLVGLGRALPFPIRVIDPGVAGELRGAVVDPTIPSGLIELRYDDVTLVELASQPDSPPILGKVLPPGTEVTSVTVGDRPGYWLTGDTHLVASLDPDGEVRVDTVRRAGDVLLWEDGGVTYRIEGATSLDAALAFAVAVR